MQREHDGQAKLAQLVQDHPQAFGVVGVLRPVDGGQDVLPGFGAQPGGDLPGRRVVGQHAERGLDDSTPLRDPRAGAAKLGLDLTRGVGQGGKRWSVPEPPEIEADDTAADGRALIDVLADGPATFAALMRATHTADGRALVRELGAELDRGAVRLDADGTWRLADLTAGL